MFKKLFFLPRKYFSISCFLVIAMSLNSNSENGEDALNLFSTYSSVISEGYGSMLEGEIELGEEFDIDVEDDTWDSSSQNRKTIFGGNRKFILQHDYAYIFTDPRKVGSNRSSLRFQWDKVVNKHVFFKADIKQTAYWKGDDILEDEKKIGSAFNVKEIYATLSTKKTNFTIGNKVVIWGEAESTPVTDVFSPQNISDLVFTSLDESRISQTMLVIERFFGSGNISLLINPDINVNEGPVSVEQSLPNRIDNKDVEIGVRWKAPIGRGDFSLMAADLVDNDPVAVISGDDQQQQYLFYGGYFMLGAAANINLGKTGLKIETAYNHQRAQELDQRATQALAYLPQGFGSSDELMLAMNADFQDDGLRVWSAGVLHTEYLNHSEFFETKEKSLNEVYLGVSEKFYYELIDVQLMHQYALESSASVSHFSIAYRATDNVVFSLDVFMLDEIIEGFNQDSTIMRLIYNF